MTPIAQLLKLSELILFKLLNKNACDTKIVYITMFIPIRIAFVKRVFSVWSAH